MNGKMHIKKGDNVIAISGKDKGKKGKVLSVDTKKRMVIVEGINMATKHKKPRKQGETGGIIHQEAALYACKVMRVCEKCGKPTRIGRIVLPDGTRSRCCKHCGEIID